MILELVLQLVEFTAPGNQHVEINPAEVVAIRPVKKEHESGNVKCVIYTVDGKFISVMEDCNVVHEKLGKE